MDLTNKALLVTHAVAAGVLTGAAIHNALLAARHRWFGAPLRARLRRLYPKVAAVAFLLTFFAAFFVVFLVAFFAAFFAAFFGFEAFFAAFFAIFFTAFFAGPMVPSNSNSHVPL